MAPSDRVFAGIRATSEQHIGNYLGAIKNFVDLQQRYECIYSIVDLHSLTTLTETDRLAGYVQETALIMLAAGIDPERTILYVQSHVPEVSELHLLLSMVTPNGWLMRVPTFKEKAREQPDNVNYGLVGYPVLQTADIILYKANRVPVGEDQLPHLELAREIVRRFNHHFGETFPEPQPELTEAPLILGLDRRKMSKSLDNHIPIASSEEETQTRVRQAITDPQRRTRSDPGRPEVCNVYSLHEYFNPERRPWIYEQCTTAGIGCVDCKKILAEGINRYFAPIREKRAELAAKPEYVREVLADGARRARAIAKDVLAEVQQKMGLSPPARR
ncbi:MAG: tryptophan--tRNA ligase [Dehalococcoidia bacterium]